MRVLVTGGAGFLGSELVRQLLRRGMQVIVLDDLSSGFFSNIRELAADKNFHFVQGSILDVPLLKECMKEGKDAVFHLAAQIHPDKSVVEPMQTWKTNTLGTMNVLEVARMQDVEVVLNASSSEVYGNAPVPFNEETTICVPATPYAASKLAGDRLTNAYYQTYGLDAVNVRCFNMFGPRQREIGYGLVIPRFVRRIVSGLSPIVYGDGLQTRDFMRVEDGAKGYLLAYDNRKELAGQAINFGGGAEIQIRKLAEIVRQIVNEKLERPVEIAYGEPRAGEVRAMVADIAKAEKFGWKKDFGLEDGIRDYVEWYLRFGGDSF